MKPPQRLPPRQRRQLIVLTVLFGGALTALLALALAWGADLPALPALLAPLRRLANPTPPPPPTPSPTDSPEAHIHVFSVPSLGEQPGPTSTPSAYFVYLAQVAMAHTPTPTLEPLSLPVGWPDAFPGLTRSKLGLHVIRNEDPYIMQFVRSAHPRVMKAVDDVGWLSDVKAASPGTLTLGRFDGQDESWAATLDPAVAAQRYIAARLERYRLNPGVDYWEGWNEFDPNDDAKLQWYGLFEAERACQMRDLGLHAAVGGFAYGVPEYAEMAYFMPALEAARRCGGIFSLHEYNSPTMACGVNSGVAGIIPGAPELGDTLLGYHSLRYRFWYEGYLKPAGIGDLPLVISELGIAGGTPGSGCNDPGGAGWKGYQDWWVRQGVGLDGPNAYLNTLAWYDAEMQKDPYVIGGTIFTAGAIQAHNVWYSMDVHELINPLAYYVARQR